MQEVRRSTEEPLQNGAEKDQASAPDNRPSAVQNQTSLVENRPSAVENQSSATENKPLGGENRPSWDQYFLAITRQISERSTCLRRKTGAMLVRDKRILTTGYNGAPSGLQHCLVVGCLRDEHGIAPGERHELCRGLHAEQNAIIQAALHGVEVVGSSLYSTHHPCALCAKMLINAGISEIFYLEGYPDKLSEDLLAEAGVNVVRLLSCVCSAPEATSLVSDLPSD